MTDPTPLEGADTPARRRLRPGLLTAGALAIAAAAVVTGATVSANAMPEPTPPATDSVTIGQVEVGDDGEATGFECTFTGEDAAAALPPGSWGEAVEATPVGPDAPATPSGAVAVAEGVIETDTVESTAGWESAPAVPAAPLPGTDGTMPQLRTGTQAECDEMLAAITGG